MIRLTVPTAKLLATTLVPRTVIKAKFIIVYINIEIIADIPIAMGKFLQYTELENLSNFRFLSE